MPPRVPTLPTMPIVPSAEAWERVRDTGVEFTEARRSYARAVVSDLVSQGQSARDQVGAVLEEVLELSRRRSEDVRRAVHHEVQRQLGSLGLATRSDLAALERRLTRASREASKTGPKNAAASARSMKAAQKSSSKAG